MKWTDASDDAYDKKNKIREGSKKDIALDSSRGVAETEMTHPFGHPKVRAQMNQMSGDAKKLVTAKGATKTSAGSNS